MWRAGITAVVIGGLLSLLLVPHPAHSDWSAEIIKYGSNYRKSNIKNPSSKLEGVHCSSQDTLTGPKGGRIRGSPEHLDWAQGWPESTVIVRIL